MRRRMNDGMSRQNSAPHESYSASFAARLLPGRGGLPPAISLEVNRAATRVLDRGVHPSNFTRINEIGQRPCLYHHLTHPTQVGISMSDFKELLDRLGHRDERERFTAVRALVGLGAAASPACPELIQMLLDDSGPVVDSAMWALESSGEAGVTALLHALERGAPELRARAACALGRYGSEPERRLRALTKSLEDEDPDVQTAATWALSELFKRHESEVRQVLGSALPELLAELIRRFTGDLGSDLSSERSWAAHELGMLGCHASAPVHLLVGIAREDEDQAVRENAFWALGFLVKGGSQIARQALNALLEEPSDVAQRAKHTLSWATSKADS